jgi:hypothetical protein
VDALIALAVVVLLLLWRRDNSGGIEDGGVSVTGADSPSPLDYTTDALDNIGQAIFQYEGGNPGNLNVRNNNPGNLKSGPGETGTADGFATFSDPGDGWNALNQWITSHTSANPGWDFYDTFDYYLRGSTSAPSVDSQGDSDAYAEYVAGFLGVDPTTPVSSVLSGG